MEAIFVTNKKVSLVLVPANEMEELQLKELLKQDNVLTEIRNTQQVLGHNIQKGVIIMSKNAVTDNLDETEKKDM